MVVLAVDKNVSSLFSLHHSKGVNKKDRIVKIITAQLYEKISIKASGNFFDK
jgi:hypothetical protein